MNILSDPSKLNVQTFHTELPYNAHSSQVRVAKGEQPTQSQTSPSSLWDSARRLAQSTLVFPLFLAVMVLVAMIVTFWLNSGASIRPSMNSTLIPADSLTPAEALATGKPTLFYFIPLEICQMRPCRPVEAVEAELRRHVPADLNFVPVGVRSAQGMVDWRYPETAFVNWDLYVIPPTLNWLPRPVETNFGQAMDAPQFFLADSEGRLLLSGGEHASLTEIVAVINR